MNSFFNFIDKLVMAVYSVFCFFWKCGKGVYDTIKAHKKAAFIAVACIVLAGLLSFLIAKFSYDKGYEKGQSECQIVEAVTEVPVIKEVKVPVEVKGDTVIKYVEKETPQDADVEIAHPAPVVKMKYNNEVHEVQGNVSESQKFENGKLQVEQKTETTLDVTPIVKAEVHEAVAKQKAVDKLETDKAVKEEHKKSNHRAINNALGGAGVGIVLGLLF